MARSDLSEILRRQIEDPKLRRELTLAETVRTDALAERIAARMQANAEETDRNLSILAAHVEANQGETDLPALERMLEWGERPTRH